MSKVELLSPAGSARALTAAVQSGADAIYTGGRLFSARQSADNFSDEELKEYIGYCHLYGVKLYIALNTLIKEREIDELAAYLQELGKLGADGIIVQDMGAAELMKRIIPETELHASTQMTVTSLGGVRFLEKHGFSRVVPARELSMKNLEYICSSCDAEIEVFGHGALCICYSGQCLMSSIIGGRSGNRGRCAQPCRLPYTLEEHGKKVRSGYLMSPKDLCLVNNIHDFKRIGIDSLKIEGRLKRPEYVAAVTGVYRKYIDDTKPAEKSDMDELMNAFNRSGFTGAYFTGQTGSGMMSISKPGNDSDNTFTAEVKKRSAENASVRKVGINMYASLFENEELNLTVWDDDGNSVTKNGTQKSEKADTKPLDKERLTAQLMKTGATPFAVSECTVEADEGITIPISEINSVRRVALDKLEQMRRYTKPQKIGVFEPKKKVERKSEDIKIFADVYNTEQLEAAIKNGVDGVYAEPVLYAQAIKNGYDKVILKMPPTVTDDMKIDLCGAKSIMITQAGQLWNLEAEKVYGDFRLNVYNSYTADFYSMLDRITISPELNLHEMHDLLSFTDCEAEVIAYGRLPLMVTQNCPAKQYKCSKGEQVYSLCDRRGERFPLMCSMGCRSIIVNSKPIFMADKMSDIKNLKINAIRLIFTVENSAECGKIISVYTNALKGLDIENPFGEGEYTRGHFYRGVL